jgi:hypothetical protein
MANYVCVMGELWRAGTAGIRFVDKGYGAPYLEEARRDRLFAGASSRGFNIPLHLDNASEAGRRSGYCGGGQRILLRLTGASADARRVM